MFTVQLEHQRLQETLRTIEWAVGDLAPLMRGIAREMEAQTEENFEAEGRPSWPTLSEVTKALREESGHWPGQILQVSGALARGVTIGSDGDAAWIGVGDDVPYAAIQQFGGMAGVNRKVELQARPYLPMDAEGALQPEAEEAILDLAIDHLKRAARL